MNEDCLSCEWMRVTARYVKHGEDVTVIHCPYGRCARGDRRGVKTDDSEEKAGGG